MNSDLLFPPSFPSMSERLYSSETLSESWDAIQESMLTFQAEQNDRLLNYLHAADLRLNTPEEGLYILQETSLKNPARLANSPLMRTENSGGYYLRCNGQGIVINPGPHFLDYFHQQGLHIRDINIVIVTRDHSEAYAEIKDIHDLNAQLNKISSPLQVIHYYLIPNALESLSLQIKPHFKHERHTLQTLDFFIDSSEVEQIELAPGIILNYFLADPTNSLNLSNKHSSSLGIRLDLLQGDTQLRIGYISGSGWTPSLSKNMEACDFLICGFGHTSSDDYKKIRFNENNLGYYGCITLGEELKPRLMICTEFEGREGDIRLEVIKKMRLEYLNQYQESKIPVIIPGNTGLLLDLKNFTIPCSTTGLPVDFHAIRAVKTGDLFKPFLYLSPTCWS